MIHVDPRLHQIMTCIQEALQILCSQQETDMQPTVRIRGCWCFQKIGVGTPKSGILIGFSVINHPFWGVFPLFLETPMFRIYLESFGYLLMLGCRFHSVRVGFCNLKIRWLDTQHSSTGVLYLWGPFGCFIPYGPSRDEMPYPGVGINENDMTMPQLWKTDTVGAWWVVFLSLMLFDVVCQDVKKIIVL